MPAPGADRSPLLLTAADLQAMPDPAQVSPGCVCAGIACAGWESIPAPLAPPLVCRLGTLRDARIDEPPYDEWSVPGEPRADYWSPSTAISPTHFPCNRCEVWACARCGRGFLQYTEFGGYYVDHRVRQIDPALVV